MKLEDIFTFENLYNAHIKCRRSKQQKGEVIRFEINLAENIYKIINEITNKKYEIGKYKKFIIYEPKKRLIEALPYKDRVILACLCENSLIPRLEKRLINDNVACRKSKGTVYGIKRLEYFLKKEFFKENNNNIYYLKCDISKYFPSIDHEILLQKLYKVGFSKDEMWLLEKIIRDQPDNINKGLPLGNQTSQWFALLYLDRLDRLIKEELRIKGYVRYMDDFILIHRDKLYLQHCLSRINVVCSEDLNIRLNEKTQIGKVYNGIDFLGFRHTLTESGKVIRKLRLSSKKKMRRRLKALDKMRVNGIVDDDYVWQRRNAFYAHIIDSDEDYFKKILHNSSQ